MKFAFVAVEKASFPVTVLCNVLEVSRSGFYEWTERVPSARSLEDAKLRVHVAAAYELGRGNYGVPRIHRELRAAGLNVSRKRVARLMGELGLKARRKRRFKATTDSNHAMPVAENVLDRKFEVDAPNVAWVTDITYVWTSEGWLYLAAILDLFSRRVVGFAMSARIDRALVLQALTAAVGRRAPNAGLVHHPDRGSQYASNDYQAALDALGVVCSMSRKGSLLGQRRRRKLLRHCEDRARLPASLRDQGRGARGDLRVHRGVLQPPASSLVHRVPEPG